MKYRKKPVVIEAFRWTGGLDQTEYPEWIVEAVKKGKITFADGKMLIETLEGTMTASPGDYTILGMKGEIYPCKPDIFDETYEENKNDRLRVFSLPVVWGNREREHVR